MNVSDLLASLITVVAWLALSAIFTLRFAATRMPVSHRVAIIGSARSGKTTLITTVFKYLSGQRGKPEWSFAARGAGTLRRVDENLRQLYLLKTLKPTTREAIFAYRGEVTVRPGLFDRRYKLEIADFPGEDTSFFAEQFSIELHDTPYFQWALSADAFVFVINAGMVLVDPSGEYVTKQKNIFRSAWQMLRKHHLDGTTNLTTKPLLLVFSKVDLLLPQIENPIPTLEGFEPFRRVSEEEVEAATHHVIGKFDDLIGYLSRESKQFHIIFTSAFAIVGNEMVGIPELARRLLPRPKLLPFRLNSKRRDASIQSTDHSIATNLLSMSPPAELNARAKDE